MVRYGMVCYALGCGEGLEGMYGRHRELLIGGVVFGARGVGGVEGGLYCT